MKPNKYDVLKKFGNIVNSCKTLDHCEFAFAYFELAKRSVENDPFVSTILNDFYWAVRGKYMRLKREKMRQEKVNQYDPSEDHF